MKAIAVIAAPVTLLALAVLPAIVSGGTDLTGPCTGGHGDLGVIVATIRHMESGDDYRAQARGSTASGAYAFVDSSWAGYGGYLKARLAPPDVQDAKAVQLVSTILTAHQHDIAAVPVAWYVGHVPPPDSVEWD